MSDNIFVCYTPLQIFNSINIVYHNINQTRGNSDILIETSFLGAKRIAENLRESGLFTDVILFSNYKSRNKIIHKILTLTGFISTHVSLYYIYRLKKLKNKKYKYVYSSVLPVLIFNLKNFFNIEAVNLFEDGLYSYLLFPYKQIPMSCKVIDRIANISRRKLTIGDFFLYVPEFFQGENNKEIRPLPVIKSNAAYLEICKKIFGYKRNNLYYDHNFIYLRTITSEIHGLKQLDEETFFIDEIYSRMLIRSHPRESHEKNSRVIKDEINNLWELEVLHSVSNNHVLISYFSTAQFIPKILCNTEPYLIFTYKIWKMKPDSEYLRMDKLINRLRKAYTQPDKIYVPESMDVYYKCIMMLNKSIKEKCL